jgi:hypothetical protein
MAPPISALVIGVGEFGQHYADILSRLNSRGLPHVPPIDRLIVTRTQFASAERLAESLQQNAGCSVKEVVAAEASGVEHVRDLLKDYHPGMIAITAKDKNLGDTIHAHYAAQATKYGIVLCEKPFCNANGDGSSLQYFHSLKRSKYSGLFGLELPLTVVAGAMMQIRDLRNLLLNASRYEFLWQARDRGDNNVIDDLVLHPWSLIPSQFKAKQIEVLDQGNQADIRVNLQDSNSRQRVTCRILLKAGGNFRGMVIDDIVVSIITEGRLTKLVQVHGSLNDAVLSQNTPVKGDVLLQVNNPLEQHIMAALRRKPIVGLSRTYESQLFLEQLRGYRP